MGLPSRPDDTAQQPASEPPRIGAGVEGYLTEAILSASREILCVFDRESRYRYVSPHAAGLLQLDPAAMVGRSWRELGLPAEFMVPFEENLHRVFRGSSTLTAEMSFPVRGERRHFEYILTPLKTTDAGVELVIANAWDVTERALMEKFLHRSEQLLRGLLDAAPNAILLTDATGTITLANEQAEILFGFPHDELVGMHIEMLMPERFRSRHMGYRKAYQASPVTRPMGAGRELYARRKDGAEFPVEISLSPLETATGPLTISIVRDITERKHNTGLFQTLLESAPDAIMIVDAAGVITLANGQAEQLFGYSRAELINMPVERLMPQRYRARHVKQRNRYQEQPETRPMGIGRELFGQRKNGEEFPVEISLSPLLTPAGPLTIVIARDVTARIATTNKIRKLNRTLERKVAQLSVVNQELEAFCYSVSHDLRAPLRGLDGFSQALLEDYAAELDETGQDYLGRIRAASQRMAQLIDDLLRLSRITRAEMILDTVDLTAIAGEILAERRAQAPHRQVTTRIAPCLSVEGDRRLLRVALENLLGNAWKFTAEQPQAEIELGIDAADQATPIYYVRDNGAGFDMAYAGRLFGPFQRLHSSQEFEGHGVGLATVQRIIQRHGGRIWADAEPQRGATFYFTLADPDFHSER
ncbi:MAG: PAS domain S-box protein [Nitrococcus mobilis]|nr:PAS domain S-box protein [Nitrococcus mobilis]